MKLQFSSISPNVIIFGVVAVGVLLLVNKLSKNDDGNSSESIGGGSSLPVPKYVESQLKDASNLPFSPLWWFKKFKEATTIKTN